MDPRFTGAATGKFILLGEHFVVHGAPAIAFPIPHLTCSVEIVPSQKISFQAQFEGDRPLDLEIKMDEALKRAALAFSLDLEKHPVMVFSKSNLELSGGFGSSAAFSVALVKATKNLVENLKSGVTENFSLEEIANNVEKTFHGNPSGVDTSTILAKSPIRFQKKTAPLEIKNKSVDFILADGGKRENCGPLVAEMSRQKDQDPARWAQLMNRLSFMVEDSVRFFEKRSEELRLLSEIVTENHKILSGFNLSTGYIDQLIEKSISLGALAGKVSGAGKGGAVVLIAKKGEGKYLANRMRENKIPVVTVVSADE